jgi:amino acid transporter
MALKRSIGLAGLTFIGVGGVLGSGWLFAPMLAAQQAGPAALVSWCIGGLAILLIALPFAEITGCLPEAGAIARLPHYSHGQPTSMVIGWSAWLGYATAAPIETRAMLRYVGPLLPGVYADASAHAGGFTMLGYAIAAAVLVLFVVINALGVAWLDKANAIVTTLKILLPLIIGLVIVESDFHIGNFSAEGGFAPYGFSGILAAISTGGVVFAYLGFRHIIDLSGEARRPHVNVPSALLLTVLICFAVYFLVEVAFIGGAPPDALANGWDHMSFEHHLGPLAGIAVVTGVSWLIALLYGGAVLGPLGAGLIATGSNARLGMALARNGFFPRFFDYLSVRSVPLKALVLGFIVGLCFLALPFDEIVALNSSAIVLSLCIGPLAVVTLRRQLPDQARSIRLPFVEAIGYVGFVVATLIVYWSGWNTIWRLDVALLIGVVIFAIKIKAEPPDEPVAWMGARWLYSYVALITVVSALGSFGGRRDVLPFGWDMAMLAAGAIVCFRLGLREARTPESTQALVPLVFEAVVEDAAPEDPAAPRVGQIT